MSDQKVSFFGAKPMAESDDFAESDDDSDEEITRLQQTRAKADKSADTARELAEATTRNNPIERATESEDESESAEEIFRGYASVQHGTANLGQLLLKRKKEHERALDEEVKKRAAVEAKVTELEIELAQVLAVSRDLKRDNSLLQSEGEKARAEASAAEEAKAQALAHYDARLKESDNMAQELISLYDQLAEEKAKSDRLAEGQVETAVLRKQLDKQGAELQQARAELTAVKQEKQQREQEAAALQLDKADLQRHLAKKTVELAKLSAEAEMSQGSLREQEAAKARADAEREAEASSLAEQLAQLREAASVEARRTEAAAAEAAEQRRLKDAAVGDLARVDAALQASSAQLAQTQESLEEATRRAAAASSLAAELEAAQAQLKQIGAADLDATKAELKQCREMLSAAVQQHTADMKAKSERLKALEAILARPLTDQSVQAQLDTPRTLASLKAVEDEVARLERENRRLAGAVEEAEREGGKAVERLQALQRQLQERTHEIEAKEGKTMVTMEKFKQSATRIANLQAFNNDLTKENERLKLAVETKNRKLAAAGEEAAGLKHRLQQSAEQQRAMKAFAGDPSGPSPRTPTPEPQRPRSLTPEPQLSRGRSASASVAKRGGHEVTSKLRRTGSLSWADDGDDHHTQMNVVKIKSLERRVKELTEQLDAQLARDDRCSPTRLRTEQALVASLRKQTVKDGIKIATLTSRVKELSSTVQQGMKDAVHYHGLGRELGLITSPRMAQSKYLGDLEDTLDEHILGSPEALHAEGDQVAVAEKVLCGTRLMSGMVVSATGRSPTERGAARDRSKSPVLSRSQTSPPASSRSKSPLPGRGEGSEGSERGGGGASAAAARRPASRSKSPMARSPARCFAGSEGHLVAERSPVHGTKVFQAEIQELKTSLAAVKKALGIAEAEKKRLQKLVHSLEADAKVHRSDVQAMQQEGMLAKRRHEAAVRERDSSIRDLTNQVQMTEEENTRLMAIIVKFKLKATVKDGVSRELGLQGEDGEGAGDQPAQPEHLPKAAAKPAEEEDRVSRIASWLKSSAASALGSARGSTDKPPPQRGRAPQRERAGGASRSSSEYGSPTPEKQDPSPPRAPAPAPASATPQRSSPSPHSKHSSGTNNQVAPEGGRRNRFFDDDNSDDGSDL